MIADRPQTVANKDYYGDWEADLMESSSKSANALLVLVERKSKFTLLKILRNQKSATVNKAIIKLLTPFKTRTITFDNGSCFSNYKEIQASLNVDPYFCNPHRPWEKGLVENTIGLIREYIPKQINKNLSSYYGIYQKIQNELNQRPRKTNNFKTPNEFLTRISQNSRLTT